MSNKPVAKVMKAKKTLFGKPREVGDILYEDDIGDTKLHVINALVGTQIIDLFSKVSKEDEALENRIEILEAKVEDLLKISEGGGEETPAPVKKRGRPPKVKD